jgi:phosphoribosylformimino-5-aminoimidazole carboxamide ribotide isomerase
LIIIPVIDLSAGLAVHARLGRRADYRPLRSTLCPDGDPLPLARRLHLDHGAPLVYIADLDAIQGSGDNHATIAAIRAAMPRLELWLDAGLRGPAGLERLAADPAIRPVIATETWSTPARPAISDAAVLSIDCDANGVRDPSGLTRDLARWTSDLLVLDLGRVGSDRGPDLALFARWAAGAPHCRHHLGGGVRTREDLDRLATAGADGVLVASALHDGRIPPAELAAVNWVH